MMSLPQIVVLCGGPSREREVSLRSGQSLARALAPGRRVQWLDLTSEHLPEGLRPERDLVFPYLHGTFGEDGQLQTLLEEAHLVFAGSGSAASRLCMDKARTRELAERLGLRVAPGQTFTVPTPPPATALVEALGPRIVLKPRAEGSSVGLRITADPRQLSTALAELEPGDWLAEQHLSGYDLTVGVLDGEPLSVVAIQPKGGVYDYTHKYTPGSTTYTCPAPISADLTHEVRDAARRLFAAADCRDFARIDFFLTRDERLFFLEINTIPGLTETSLLPMSARPHGLDFAALTSRMLAPALRRFHER